MFTELLGASPFDTVNGLPVHVLVVHAVVVLLPLAGLGAIVIALVPRWSVRFGPLVWIVAVVALAASFVAQESGLVLAQRVGVPAEHMQLGEQVKWYALVLVVLSFVLWLLDRRNNGGRSILVKVLAVLVILASLAAIWGAFRAGDSGAQAVWSEIIENTRTPR